MGCGAAVTTVHLHDVGFLFFTPLSHPLFWVFVDLAVSGCLTQHWLSPQGAK
jgi:hypothetical protein